MHKNSVLEIENLTFSYNKQKDIYKNFSLSLNVGEIVAITGESGSGKSTLFSLISKELKPDSGTVKSKKIAQIYQDPYSSFHPSYTIINQIEDVSYLDGLEDILSIVDINRELLLKKPHELSGGQLQRCSIIRAILMKPELILADEPTSALDNITSLNVMKFLISLIDRCSILLITHDLDLAKWCSNRVIELQK